MQNGLFQVNLKLIKANKSYLSESSSCAAVNWHRKLGHISNEGLKTLQMMNEEINLKTTDLKDLEKVCEICNKAKQTRKKFKNLRTKAERPLQIIHTDLCGPIDPPTWDGKRYVITFLDDFTHHTMAFLIKTKDEVPEKIKVYTERVEARWNLRVSKMRCNNGKEYINRKVIAWCENKGIELDTTVPYTPQLNGKAERLNRTLMDKTRALLFDSGLEKEMWGEALYTSVYLTDRSPTNTLKTTPFEMWEGKKPSLKHLQLYGSEAFAKVLKPIKKLQERSKSYVFVGYAPTGYRLWDKEKRKIKIARDVNFREWTVKKAKTENREITINKLINEQEDKEQNEIAEEEDNEQENSEEEDYTDAEEENFQLENEQEQSEEDEEHTARRSNRARKRPDWYGDYVLLTFEEAVTNPEKQKWIQAIKEEKESLKENNTWDVLDIKELKNKKPLHSKWIFKIKQDGRYKARLVIKGCEQKYRVDYMETYSPVIGSTALRSLFAMAVMKNYKIVTFDIKAAFLYGELTDEVYMYPPEGYDCKGKIFKLKKALYGLKQAPLRWNIKFTNFLKKKGFQPLKSEQCLFTKRDSEMIMGIYVDDGIIIADDSTQIEQILENLKKEFKISVMQEPDNFVGFEIAKIQNIVKLSQKEYIKRLLTQCGMNNAKPVKIPMQPGDVTKTEPKTKEYPYREIIGSLLYVSTKTRPDIAYSVGFCSRYVEAPTQERITDLKHILKYLNGNVKQGIVYEKTGNVKLLKAFCDADYAGDKETRRSTTGYVIMYAGGAISWCSRKQSVIALSSTKAEYIAARSCCT